MTRLLNQRRLSSAAWRFVGVLMFLSSFSCTRGSEATSRSVEAPSPSPSRTVSSRPGENPVAAAVKELGAGVLLVSSPHCGASDDLMPSYDALAAKYGDTIHFAKVEAEENQLIAPYSGVPWVFVVRGGVIVDAQTGAYGGEAGQRLNEKSLEHLLARNGLIAKDPSTLLRLFPRELIRPNMSDRTLSTADFDGADLSHKNFSRAQLTGARLTNADLRGTNFNGAFLQHADMRGARVDETTTFADAHFLYTTCPDGTIAGKGESDESCAAHR